MWRNLLEPCRWPQPQCDGSFKKHTLEKIVNFELKDAHLISGIILEFLVSTAV
jgi:hypothetical protein